MKRGFSLLEVTLAIGILGSTLPLFLTYMAESANNSERQVQSILLLNAQKNTQNLLMATNMEIPLDGNNQAYCGYKNGIFTISNAVNNFDSDIFVLGRDQLLSIANGGAKMTVYALCAWDTKNNKPRLTVPRMEVIQSTILSNLNKDE